MDDKQLVDLNGVLNTGDVPKLYEAPDLEEQKNATGDKKRIE